MEERKPQRLVFDALDERVERSLREWRLHPGNEFVAQSFNANLNMVLEKGGALTLRLKGEARKGMSENDIDRYGFPDEEGYLVFGITAKRFLSLEANYNDSCLCLKAQFNGNKPVVIGQFSPEQIESLTMREVV